MLCLNGLQQAAVPTGAGNPVVGVALVPVVNGQSSVLNSNQERHVNSPVDELEGDQLLSLVLHSKLRTEAGVLEP